MLPKLDPRGHRGLRPPGDTGGAAVVPLPRLRPSAVSCDGRLGGGISHKQRKAAQMSEPPPKQRGRRILSPMVDLSGADPLAPPSPSARGVPRRKVQGDNGAAPNRSRPPLPRNLAPLERQPDLEVSSDAPSVDQQLLSAQERIRSYNRQRKKLVQEREDRQANDDQQRQERLERASSQVQATRRESARRSADIHRQEREARESALKERENAASERRKRMQQYAKPDRIRGRLREKSLGPAERDEQEEEKEKEGETMGTSPRRQKVAVPSHATEQQQQRKQQEPRNRGRSRRRQQSQPEPPQQPPTSVEVVASEPGQSQSGHIMEAEAVGSAVIDLSNSAVDECDVLDVEPICDSSDLPQTEEEKAGHSPAAEIADSTSIVKGSILPDVQHTKPTVDDESGVAQAAVSDVNVATAAADSPEHDGALGDIISTACSNKESADAVGAAHASLDDAAISTDGNTLADGQLLQDTVATVAQAADEEWSGERVQEPTPCNDNTAAVDDAGLTEALVTTDNTDDAPGPRASRSAGNGDLVSWAARTGHTNFACEDVVRTGEGDATESRAGSGAGLVNVNEVEEAEHRFSEKHEEQEEQDKPEEQEEREEQDENEEPEEQEEQDKQEEPKEQGEDQEEQEEQEEQDLQDKPEEQVEQDEHEEPEEQEEQDKQEEPKEQGEDQEEQQDEQEQERQEGQENEEGGLRQNGEGEEHTES